MKKILFSLLFLMFTGIYLAAQAPSKFRYQAVARDASGVVYTNTSLEMRFSFLEGGQFGAVRYVERHIVSVNPTGAFELTLGDGSVVFGNFTDINWSNNQYWLKVELNPNPGSGSFTNMGTSQLLTVPYAMFARQAGNANFTAGQGISISPDQIITNTGDLSTTNELQQLSISNNVLTLSNSGGSVTLPTVTFTAGNGISISGNVISNTGDADASPTNEIQVLGLSGNILNLSNGGGSVTLPTGADNWGSQVVQTGNALNGNGTSASPLNVAQQGATTGQALKWNGTSWIPQNDNAGTDAQMLSVAGNQLSISNGNTVTIPPDADASPTNELQVLGLSGNSLNLSNGGGSVTLPTGADNWGSQVVQTGNALSGNGTSASPLNMAQQGATTGQALKWNGTSWVPQNDDAGTDAQTLSVSGNQISISNGNSVAIPPDADSSPTNELQVLGLSGNTISLSNGGGSVTLPLGTDSQTLSVTGNQLSISNGNSVTIPGDTNPGDDITIGYAASGDLSGHYPNPSVAKIQGRSISVTAPTNGQALLWNGLEWAPGSNGDTNPSDDINVGTTAGGDLNGTYPNPTVDGLQGRPVSSSVPAVNQVLQWNGSQWTPSSNCDTNPSDDINVGTTAGGDLNGTYPNPTVDGLQGRPLSSSVPAANQVLQWNGSQWIPSSNFDTNPNDDVHGSGTTNYVSKFTNPTTLGNSQIYDNGTNVGIGTTVTTSKLNIGGDARLIDGKLLMFQGGEAFNIDLRPDGMVAFEANGTTGDNSLIINDDGDKSVMIGTNVPIGGFKLLVTGKAKFNDGVFFGTVEGFTDGGSNKIASNSSINPTSHLALDLGTSTMAWDEVYADDFVNISDARNKTNVRNLSYGMKEIMKLRPVTFNWDLKDHNERPHIGLIAQEVQGVVKEAVVSENYEYDIRTETGKWTPSDRLGISYNSIIPVLIAGMQEQQRSIETLQDQITQLRAELKALKEAQIKK